MTRPLPNPAMCAEDFLEAARVPASIEPQVFGPWKIERHAVSGYRYGWPTVTVLRRWTMTTLHKDLGEIVMEDSRRELSRHLPIWLKASGRVLVSGLGLGCVVRGLLASPKVEHIDVVEIDPKIIHVVGAEFQGDDRMTIHCGDALSIEWRPEIEWRCAWHDIWCEGSGLQVLHTKLIARYQDRCSFQGAWMLPRFAKRRIPGVIG